MALAKIPPPINAPILDAGGRVSRPWVEYFLKLSGSTDQELAGYMTKAVYDPANSGVVDNAEALGGHAASYYLNRANHTGNAPASSIRFNTYTTTTAVELAPGDMCSVDATVSAISVYLPPAYSVTGCIVGVRKDDVSANNVTIYPYNTDLIDGAASEVITTKTGGRIFIANGNGWHIYSST